MWKLEKVDERPTGLDGSGFFVFMRKTGGTLRRRDGARSDRTARRRLNVGRPSLGELRLFPEAITKQTTREPALSPPSKAGSLSPFCLDKGDDMGAVPLTISDCVEIANRAEATKAKYPGSHLMQTGLEELAQICAGLKLIMEDRENELDSARGLRPRQ